MASNFINKTSASVGTSTVDLYVVSAGNYASVIGLNIANTKGAAITVDVTQFDASTGNTLYIVKAAPIPVGGSIVVIGGNQKLILQAGDKISVKASTTVACDAILSALEVTP